MTDAVAPVILCDHVAAARGSFGSVVQASIASTTLWYSATLGFNAHVVPESPPHHFGILRKDDVQIFLQQLDGYRKPDLYDEREGGVWSVYLQMHGVREFFHALSRLHDVTMLSCHCVISHTDKPSS